MRLSLTRYGSTPFGTFGELQGAGLHVFTVERPWLNNQPFESCIAAGDYQLRRHRSPRFGNTWAVVNTEAQVYQDKPPTPGGRWGILLHPANLAHQLAGCIAPGERLGALRGRWGVLDSRLAFDRLSETLSVDREHILEIRWALAQSGELFQVM